MRTRENEKHFDSNSDDEFDDCITLGRSSEYPTIKWPFPLTNQCPLTECDLTLSSRTYAMVHFRLNHAATSMLCTICNVPFSSISGVNLQTHYETCHPTETPPEFRSVESSESEEFIQEISDNEEENSDGNGNGSDWITLGGCGKTTRWQFPPQRTLCPFSSCSMDFEVRSDAIAHYKEQHANTSILCYICDWPISAIVPIQFQMHFERFHPKMAVPFQFDSCDQQSTSNEEETLEMLSFTETEDENDLIPLSGSDKISYWHFPQKQTECPMRSCGVKFKRRSAAIQHYREKHAKSAILCHLCEKPIGGSSSGLKNHYKHIHPNEVCPLQCDDRSIASEGQKFDTEETEKDDAKNGIADEGDGWITLRGCGKITYWLFPLQLTRCPVRYCHSKCETRSEAIAHYKVKHANTSILCRECNLPVCANNLSTFEEHYRNKHEHAEAPCPFDQTKKLTTKQTVDSNELVTKEAKSSPKEEMVESNMEKYDEDVIELSGCGKITYWRFPAYQTRCIVRTCHREFVNRLAALEHYKRWHAKKSIYCNLCEKPICVQTELHFKVHYRKTHPHKRYQYEEPNGETEEQSAHSETDDLIELGGMNRVTYWKFPPEVRRCPMRTCNILFETRSEAIQHYKGIHAEYATACHICEKPIKTKKVSKPLEAHFLSNHPHVKDALETFHSKTTITKPQKAETTQDANDQEDVLKLHGGSQTTYWRFPDEITHCPMMSCKMKFDSRSDAILHFRNTHAVNFVLCSACDSLVYARGSKQFERHLAKCRSASNHSAKQTEKIHSNEEDSMSMENDDLITLTGYDYITQWTFPLNTKRCPFEKCDRQFDIRSDAIVHFKQSHAMNSVLCPTCDFPIQSDRFVKHHQSTHKNLKFPYSFDDDVTNSPDNKIKKSTPIKSKQCDDLISLHGCGRSTQWRFPKHMKICPTCNSSFESRSAAILHYRTKHANAGRYCSICDEPIHSPSSVFWKLHCKKFHSNMPMPIQSTSDRVKRCKLCRKKFRPYQFSQHLREAHNLIRIKCPLQECQFNTKEMDLLRSHWSDKHGNLRFPNICDENDSNGNGDERRQNDDSTASSDLELRNENSATQNGTEQMDTDDSDQNLLEPMDKITSGKGRAKMRAEKRRSPRMENDQSESDAKKRKLSEAMDMNWSDGSEMRGRDIRDELSSPESEEEDQLDGTGSSSNELYSTMTIKQECIEDVSFEMCAGESDDSNHFSDAEMNESEEQAATELSRDMEVTSTVPEYDLHSMNI